MELDLPTIFNGLTAAAVVFGVAFGVVQIRQFERKRAETAAFAILQTIQSGKTFHAGDRVSALPDGMAWRDFERLDPEMIEAISEIHVVGETLGYAVYRRLLPLSSVDELMGGNIRTAWKRLRPWAEHMREVQGSPNAFEWFQWLAERLEQRPVAWKAKGAHVAHKEWEP